MSGFGRGSKPGHGGRGGGSGGGIAALRRGMPAKKNQMPLKHSAAPPKSIAAAAAAPAEESFQLSCAPQGASQFAMVIRLTPGLLDDLRRVEAEGGTSTLKFGTYPTGHLIKVGQEEFKFLSAPEQGDLCDIYEEHQGGDGGTLVAAGSAWRKLSVQRTLSASEKDRVKKMSVEAEQQLKSRKAIVLDSNLMKPEPPRPAENAGRRPPLKTKKEPPQKKRKVTAPAVPPAAKSKPPSSAHSLPVPAKEKTSAAAASSVIAEPVLPPAASPPPPPPPQATAQQTHPVNLAPVEEIVVGSSPQVKNTPAQVKDKAPAVTTPETLIKTTTTTSGPLSMNDLRNSIIVLLTANPKGLPLKFLEKSLGDGVPQPARKNIEKILKSIASYQPPGKYMLKPGVKQEHYARPSPGSTSLPEAVTADSPESPARAAESKEAQELNDGEGRKLLKPSTTPWEKEQLPVAVEVERLEVERIDVGEEENQSPAEEHKAEAMLSDGGTPEAGSHPDVDTSAPESKLVEEPNASKPAGSSSSSSGSDSESDSDSDSSSESGSGSGSGSGSDSSSSDSDEDEEVDIVSEDENHKAKAKAEKKAGKHKSRAERPGSEEEEANKESDDIDIGDADDTKLDSAVDRIIETIPLDVDLISCGDGSPEIKPEEALDDGNQEERDLPGSERSLPKDFEEGEAPRFKEQRVPSQKSPRDDREPAPRVSERDQARKPQAESRRFEADHRQVVDYHGVHHSQAEKRYDQAADYQAGPGGHPSQAESRRYDQGADHQAGPGAHHSQAESRRVEADHRQSMEYQSGPGVHHPQAESRRHEAEQRQAMEHQSGAGVYHHSQGENRRYEADHRQAGDYYSGAGVHQSQADSRRYEADRHAFEFYPEPPAAMDVPPPPRAPDRPGKDEQRGSRDDGRFQARDEHRPIKEKKRKWNPKDAPAPPPPPPLPPPDTRSQMDRRFAPELENRGASDLELGEFRETTPEPTRKEEIYKPRVEAESLKAAPYSRKPETRVSTEEPAVVQHKSKLRKQASQQQPVVSQQPPPPAAPAGAAGVAAPAAKFLPEKPAKMVQQQQLHQTKGSSFETNPPTGEIKAAGRKKNSSAEAKSKDSSGDSIQSKGVEFFAAYEKDSAELRGAIKSYEQYKEYCREYREKHPIYIQLNSSLEFDRENFESLHRDMEMAKGNNDQSRLASIQKKVTQDYLNCRKRFKRMAKTFLVLHEELRVIKDRCKDYARQS